MIEKLYYSPAELLPIPKISRPRKIAKKSEKTTIITSSPYLQELKLQKATKTTFAQKRNIKQVKRKIADDITVISKRKRVQKDVTDDSRFWSWWKTLVQKFIVNLSEFSDDSAEDANRALDAIYPEEKVFTLSEEN